MHINVHYKKSGGNIPPNIDMYYSTWSMYNQDSIEWVDLTTTMELQECPALNSHLMAEVSKVSGKYLRKKNVLYL